MNRKKLLPFYASAALTAVVLAGCANSQPAPQAGPQVQTSNQTVKESKIKDADLSKIPDTISAPKTSETGPEESIAPPQAEVELEELTPPAPEPEAPVEEEQPSAEELTEPPVVPEGNTISEEEAAALDAAADALLPPEETPWIPNPDAEAPLLPDGTVAPKPGDVEVVTPAPPNTSPDPEPDPELEVPVEEPTHANEIELNNIELADACLGVPVETLNNAIGITDGTAESNINGQCRLASPNVDNDEEGTGVSITINYLPAKTTFIDSYKKGKPVSGIGDQAFLSTLGEESTLILAIQGDYATLITTTGPSLKETDRDALTALASTQALQWITQLAPPAVSYWETHGGIPVPNEDIKDNFTPGVISPVPDNGMVLPGADDTPEVREKKQAVATIFDTAKMKVQTLIFDLF